MNASVDAMLLILIVVILMPLLGRAQDGGGVLTDRNAEAEDFNDLFESQKKRLTWMGSAAGRA
ncbi:hypothetical protein [Rhizobium sp. CC-YZS058]|uniref:hypothetical protein n=1 Tax=Rhizobium sp. CC-YZS058 TaxID=3042153 RepID=UPI002B05EC6A|nr:hypothetical protein [Rhizobium sp. CC-YZS058]MEA3535440.1 hypothetical protein [Rhizobium sp. CC-YZS058]